MTLLDSVDSILMLYSYSGFPERGFSIFEPSREPQPASQQSSELQSNTPPAASCAPDQQTQSPPDTRPKDVQGALSASDDVERSDAASVAHIERMERQERVKRHLMSGLSIVLTFMSIVVAFR